MDGFELLTIITTGLLVFVVGLYIGTLIPRRYLNDVIGLTDKLVQAIALDKSRLDRNVVAMAEFHRASLVYHLTPKGSDGEQTALGMMASAIENMDDDVRKAATDAVDSSYEVIEKYREGAKEAEASEAEEEEPAEEEQDHGD
jgi:hypothetical protein